MNISRFHFLRKSYSLEKAFHDLSAGDDRTFLDFNWSNHGDGAQPVSETALRDGLLSAFDGGLPAPDVVATMRYTTTEGVYLLFRESHRTPVGPKDFILSKIAQFISLIADCRYGEAGLVPVRMIEPYKLSLVRALPIERIFEVAEEILWEEVLERFAREASPEWIRETGIGALPIEPAFPPAMIAEMQEALRRHEEQQGQELEGLSSQQLIRMAEEFATQDEIGKYKGASRSSVIRIRNETENVTPKTEAPVRDACMEIIASRGGCLKKLREDAAAHKRSKEVAARKLFRAPSSKNTR